jgi:hypothetical protein
MSSESISSAIDFLKIVKSEKELTVQFEKKDGTQRLMKCTLDFNRIPKEKKPKGVDLTKILSKIQKSKILSVFDLEKQDWRSVPFDRLEYVITPSKKMYKINRLK